MSTDYDIHCVTCGKYEPHWNGVSGKRVLRAPNTDLCDFRDGALLQTMLIEDRPLLEQLGMSFTALKRKRGDDYYSLGFDNFSPYTVTPVLRIAIFLAEHDGHELVVMSESGETWAEYLEQQALWDAEKRAKGTIP